jgi:two-component system, cell cycle sensor histidine kinase and response regulator CckA
MGESTQFLQPADEVLSADDLPHIVWISAADGTTNYLNRYGRDFLGLAPNEANTQVWVGLVHPDHRTAVRRTWKEASRSEAPYEVEYRLKRADGSYRWILERAVPRRDADGQVRSWVGTCTDVEDQKRAVASLRESEERDVFGRKRAERALEQERAVSETLLASLPALVGVVDRRGRLVRWNQNYAEATGLPNEELLGRDVLATVIDEDRPRLAETMRRVFEDGGYEQVEGRARNAQGEVREYVFAGRRVEIGGETFIVSTGLDVTDRRRAEEQQARLSQVVEQTAESIVITDPGGSILYVNPAFEAVSGYTRAEAIGQNPRILKSGNQDAAFYRRMWEVLARGEVWTGRLINRRKDGILFEEDATIGPVRDATGRVTSYVAVKRDVTNETRLERQLLQAQKIEAVGRLAGGIAHDFNNLLGVIMGYADLVRRGLGADHPLGGKVDQIRKATERAAALTRQLLAFSRKQVLQPKVIDLNGVLRDVEPMLRRLIGEDIELRTILEPRLGRVKADPFQIEQVVMNLALNARDAMPEGGHLTFETQDAALDAECVAQHPVVPPGRYVMLAVSDTGAGMDAETQAHAFEPFFTTKDAGKGTGLGLATVYGIVKQSEGYIWLYSEVGLGTTFKIYLPRVDEAEVVDAPGKEPTRLAAGHETVLVVEDEASLRDVLCETLESGGYTVLVARDGAEAVRIAGEYAGAIHLIVTDAIMPGLTGRKTVEQIIPTRPETNLLFISGYTDEAIAKQGVLLPGAAFLSKPFTPDDLLRKVRAVLEGEGGLGSQRPQEGDSRE